MKGNGKIAIVLGATGLTGGILLKQLIRHEGYHKIKVFGRTSVGFTHPKMEEHLGDLFELHVFEAVFTGDVVFCCIGTTKAKTPDKAIYRQIDFGIPVSAAQLAGKNGIGTYIVISALGANAESGVFYNRIKGEMEAAVLRAGRMNTYILQPSLISGYREERRTGEWMGKQFMRVLNVFLIGKAAKYKAIAPETIVRTMLWVAEHGYGKFRLPSNLIQDLAKKQAYYD